MRVYIKNQEGDGLIEKGKILVIGSTKKTCLLTGKDMEHLVHLGMYKDEQRAKEILNEIMQRIVQPTARELSNGIIFIDLEGTE